MPRVDSRQFPLGFDNPAFRLQLPDESFQIHRSSVYARLACYATPGAADPRPEFAA